MDRLEHDRLVIAEHDIQSMQHDISEIKGDVKLILGFVSRAQGMGMLGVRLVAVLALAVSALSFLVGFL